MTSNLIVVYDSCVLYSNYLRDILIQLTLTDLFSAKWTDSIHDEWIGNLLKNRPDLQREQLFQVKNLMNSKVRDCLVENFEQLIPILSLPDPNDRHVLAAIACEADFIITFNLKDFPDTVLATYEIAAKHPDNFIAELLDVNPAKVMNAIEIARKRFKNPPRDFDEYMEILLRQGLSISVSMLQEFYGN